MCVANVFPPPRSKVRIVLASLDTPNLNVVMALQSSTCSWGSIYVLASSPTVVFT